MKIAINLRKIFICMTCLLCLAVAFVFVGCSNDTSKETPGETPSAQLAKSDYVLALNTTIQKMKVSSSTNATTASIGLSTADYEKVTEQDNATKTLSAILTFIKNIYESDKYDLKTGSIAFEMDVSAVSSYNTVLWKMSVSYNSNVISIMMALSEKDEATRDNVELYKAEIEYTKSTQKVGNFMLEHYISNGLSCFKGIGDSVYSLKSATEAFKEKETYYGNNALRIYNQMTVTKVSSDFFDEYKSAMSSQAQ